MKNCQTQYDLLMKSTVIDQVGFQTFQIIMTRED